jgi:hypothetical protein
MAGKQAPPTSSHLHLYPRQIRKIRNQESRKGSKISTGLFVKSIEIDDKRSIQ